MSNYGLILSILKNFNFYYKYQLDLRGYYKQLMVNETTRKIFTKISNNVLLSRRLSNSEKIPSVSQESYRSKILNLLIHKCFLSCPLMNSLSDVNVTYFISNIYSSFMLTGPGKEIIFYSYVTSNGIQVAQIRDGQHVTTILYSKDNVLKEYLKKVNLSDIDKLSNKLSDDILLYFMHINYKTVVDDYDYKRFCYSILGIRSESQVNNIYISKNPIFDEDSIKYMEMIQHCLIYSIADKCFRDKEERFYRPPEIGRKYDSVYRDKFNNRLQYDEKLEREFKSKYLILQNNIFYHRNYIHDIYHYIILKSLFRCQIYKDDTATILKEFSKTGSFNNLETIGYVYEPKRFNFDKMFSNNEEFSIGER